MVDLQVEYTRKVMAALKLKDDPVLAMVEIDNETSLLRSLAARILDKRSWATTARNGRQWKRVPQVRDGAAAGSATITIRFSPIATAPTCAACATPSARQQTRTCPIAGTQMGYGGMLNLETHAGLDYQDNHFYIDHYSFPHASWDTRDWRIRDTSAVGTGMSAILNMAVSRETGRPYTVSEFNQPYPNRQAAELDPTLAAFGAFQDWDAIMHFAYSHGRALGRRRCLAASTSTAIGPSGRTSGNPRGCSALARSPRESRRWRFRCLKKCGCSSHARGS